MGPPQFAEANDMKIRFHPLVMGTDYREGKTIGEDWHPTPVWIHNGDFNREEMINILYDYVETVMNRYSDRIDEWVVVNEPIWWGSEGGLKNNVWQDRIGEDYIELAFRKAREVAPNAVLILNEVGVDFVGQKIYYTAEEDFYNLVKGLVAKRVPLDAVGFEFHLTIPEHPWETEPTVDKILANFERYGRLGLDVIVSELDVKIKEPITQEKLERQAEVYAIVMEAVLDSDSSRSISVWGQSDRYSWITYSKYHWPDIPDQFPGYSAASLYDEHHEPKPAYYAVLEVLGKYPSPPDPNHKTSTIP
ncbi:MAG: hypothetical protein BZY88_06820 [SAR202 cluster bacterium Io17-Chloro-G9]|nr:MAG: hypothetical protein BZY88_06820 [SAR202 cluster bacterium Io17-Chloro-G9]